MVLGVRIWGWAGNELKGACGFEPIHYLDQIFWDLLTVFQNSDRRDDPISLDPDHHSFASSPPWVNLLNPCVLFSIQHLHKTACLYPER